MSRRNAPETVLSRVRAVVGTAGVERLDPGAVRLLLGELLFDGHGIPDWHQQAVCRDADQELFFPASGSTAQTSAAKQICAGCPVRTACLADVMAWERPGYRYGVVGGLSADERRQLARAHRQQTPSEGGAAA